MATNSWLLGVNLSGGEYGIAGQGQLYWTYVYPTDAELDHFAADGATVIRLPLLWERLQPSEFGALSQTELANIDHIVARAAADGLKVIIDPHDYGNGFGNMIGTAGTPNSAFADFWGKLAAHYASTPNVIFGLMNEPYQQTAGQWLQTANGAIAAIRSAGATQQEILVPGTSWDGAWTWASSGNQAAVGSQIVDPSQNYAFEVHQYLDSDGSGTHSNVVSATVGVDRLTQITNWAESTGNRLFLGEFGVANDPTSLSALSNMLTYMQQHADVWQGGTYWDAGPWLGNYMYSAEPVNGVDTAQMNVLKLYMNLPTYLTPSPTAPTQLPTSNPTSPSNPHTTAPIVAATVQHVFRFTDMTTGSQFLTNSEAEANTVKQTRPDMAQESSSFGSYNAIDQSGTVAPVYRFFDTANGVHFLTSSRSEELNLVATRPDLVLENSFLYEHTTQQSGDVPVFRFFESSNGTHFYTGSQAESANIQNTRPDMVYEGVAFFAPGS